METLKIKKAALLMYALIGAAGKYTLEVASNVSEKNLFTDENGRQRYIVNLKAIASDKQGQIIAAFGDQDELPIEQTNGLFLTGSIWKNEGQESTLPMKGEKVEAAIDLVEDREGNQVFRITNLRVKAAITASKFSFASSPVKAEVVKEETLEVAKA